MNNTIEILISAKDAASGVINSIGSSLGSVGGGFIKAGAAITAATAGITAELYTAGKAALEYNGSMTSTAATLGLTADAQKQLSTELLKFGATTEAGPQAVADAYGVLATSFGTAADRMAVLKAANTAAEAGNTDLGSSAKSLVGILNGFQLGAGGASHATDILAQMVHKGAGTMTDFAAALPTVAGAAKALGANIDDVGTEMAFLTKHGDTATQAASDLNGAMTALLKPNTNMKKALAELGFSSGQAAVEQLGLAGAFKAVKGTQEAAKDGFTTMARNVDSLRAVTLLAGDDFTKFATDFASSSKGAAAAMQAIQDASPEDQLKLLNSAVQTVQISIGNALLPALNGIMLKIKPVVDAIVDWVTKNPELVQQIAMVAGGLALLGPALIIVGTVISALASPVVLVVGALVAFGAALATNFGGIRTRLQPAIDWLTNAFDSVKIIVNGVVGILQGKTINGTDNIFTYLFGDDNHQGGITYFLTSIGVAQGAAETFAQGLGNAIQNIANWVTGTAMPALQQFADWFLNTALPAVVGFVTGTVIPAIGAFFTWLGNAWATIQPGLMALADWFLNTALPAVVGFVTGTVLPAVQAFFTWLGNAWATIQPGLAALANWFINDALPAVVAIVRDVVIPMIQNWINILVSVWNTVEPVLSSLANWFITDVMPKVVDFIQNTVIPAVQHIIDIFVSIWDTVGPILNILAQWFITDVMPKVIDFINGPVHDAVQGFINILKGIWDFVKPGLEALRDGIKPILQAIQTFFQPVVDFVNTLIQRINDLKGLAGTYQGAAQNASTAVNMVTSGQVSPGQFVSALAHAVGAEVSGGHALGVDFIQRPQMAMLHRGERVLTANENSAFSGGGSSGPTLNFGEGSVIIQSDTAAGGAAAAQGFWGQLGELMQQNAVTLS